ncbi:PP0621 family protein [Undibacterium oligocarboniphilum]|uniref:Uncharacterized protein n=1 Tax=Undibacterium oligocarboniphilum TaxID=666702 RepID=A0A850QF46_9BURK|nr:PP0621 family protein [Undibacterium oligocarboniphilum]MBC3869931.1 hypothetical protein [Undibacterium oligocarboniphilum]NVO77547.1 hypothetical protein [Undibacterium oligocarboniphilum]
MRLLIWLVFGLLVILAIRKKARPAAQDMPPPVTPSAAGDAETMVCCAHCQIYLPASEAVIRGQQTFCSTAHADLH